MGTGSQTFFPPSFPTKQQSPSYPRNQNRRWLIKTTVSVASSETQSLQLPRPLLGAPGPCRTLRTQQQHGIPALCTNLIRNLRGLCSPKLRSSVRARLSLCRSQCSSARAAETLPKQNSSPSATPGQVQALLCPWAGDRWGCGHPWSRNQGQLLSQKDEWMLSPLLDTPWGIRPAQSCGAELLPKQDIKMISVRGCLCLSSGIPQSLVPGVSRALVIQAGQSEGLPEG